MILTAIGTEYVTVAYTHRDNVYIAYGFGFASFLIKNAKMLYVVKKTVDI